MFITWLASGSSPFFSLSNTDEPEEPVDYQHVYV